MKLSEFNYNLPKELIAQDPILKRDHSRLMVVHKNNNIEHKQFFNIIDYLKKGDVLVINETKVRRSVFNGKKESGSPAKLVILKKLEENNYLCRIDSRSPKNGTKLVFDDFSGTILNNDNGIYSVEFDKNIDSIIEKKGKVLLPSYVKNEDILESRYQTEYASKLGSLAAPTAGLHFTKEILQKIESKGIKIVKVCLHVSYGTFLPILTEDVSKHKMEKEYFEISKDSADIINSAKRLFVVGTTSLKALESSVDETGKVNPKKEHSNLFITPNHKIKTPITGLITNFHLPKSTLLLLVSSFWGKENILKLYNQAIKEKYKFYSFGDSMLLLNDSKD